MGDRDGRIVLVVVSQVNALSQLPLTGRDAAGYRPVATPPDTRHRTGSRPAGGFGVGHRHRRGP